MNVQFRRKDAFAARAPVITEPSVVVGLLSRNNISAGNMLDYVVYVLFYACFSVSKGERPSRASLREQLAKRLT